MVMLLCFWRERIWENLMDAQTVCSALKQLSFKEDSHVSERRIRSGLCCRPGFSNCRLCGRLWHCRLGKSHARQGSCRCEGRQSESARYVSKGRRRIQGP